LRETNQLKILFKIGQIVDSSNTPNSVFSRLLEICHDEFDFHRSFIVFYDDANKNLQVKTKS